MLQRSLCAWGAAGWSASALLGCQRSGPVRIGFLGPLSGRVADLGVGGRNGAQLAVDEVNASGGLAGQPIELMAKDDAQNNDLARTRLKELADAGVALVIGPMTSAVAIAVRAYASELGLVLISPTASAPELVGQDDALFCLSPNALESARQHAEFLHHQGFRRVASVAETHNKAFALNWVHGARTRCLALGGKWMLDLQYESSPTVNYGAMAQQLVAAQADVLLLVASATDSAMLAQQIRRRDERVALTITPWAANDPLIQLGGRALEGTFVMQLLDRSSTAAPYLQFVQRYRERFGDAPGYRAMRAHEAVMLAARALGQRGLSVRDALRGFRSHPGLQNTLTFDAFGDATSPLYATRVRQGQFENLPLRGAPSAASAPVQGSM